MSIGDLYAAGPAIGEPRRLVADPADRDIQHLNPEALFDGRRLMSQVILAPAGRTFWISGLIGCGPENRLVGPDKTDQIRQAFANLRAAIAAAGALPGDIVRVTEYVVDYAEADITTIRDGIAALFPTGRYPTNVLVPVPRLGRDGALFEIDAWGVLPENRGT